MERMEGVTLLALTSRRTAYNTPQLAVTIARLPSDRGTFWLCWIVWVPRTETLVAGTSCLCPATRGIRFAATVGPAPSGWRHTPGASPWPADRYRAATGTGPCSRPAAGAPCRLWPSSLAAATTARTCPSFARASASNWPNPFGRRAPAAWPALDTMRPFSEYVACTAPPGRLGGTTRGGRDHQTAETTDG